MVSSKTPLIKQCKNVTNMFQFGTNRYKNVKILIKRWRICSVWQHVDRRNPVLLSFWNMYKRFSTVGFLLICSKNHFFGKKSDFLSIFFPCNIAITQLFFRWFYKKWEKFKTPKMTWRIIQWKWRIEHFFVIICWFFRRFEVVNPIFDFWMKKSCLLSMGFPKNLWKIMKKSGKS